MENQQYMNVEMMIKKDSDMGHGMDY
jgi:hypothetical protein